MANQAAKKAEQRIKDFRLYHGGAILAVLAFYALMKFGLFYSTWERFHTYAFSASVAGLYTCYSIVYSNLESGGLLEDKGGWTEPCRDMLYLILFTVAAVTNRVLSTLSQAIALASDSCWYLLVIIPIVAVYKVFTGLILPYFSSSEPVEEGDAPLSKTQQKKQKRAEKFGGR